MNDNFMFELVKAERDKCLIETIKLTEQELEEVFDKVNMSEENRIVYKNVYFNEN